MIHLPRDANAFEFVRVASLRAAQLMRGCLARVPAGVRCVQTAQLEVLAGKVRAEVRGARQLAPGLTARDLEPVLKRTAG